MAVEDSLDVFTVGDRYIGLKTTIRISFAHIQLVGVFNF